MMEKKGYVVTHTHWDREWRYPIWESRMYLAEMLDELLTVLETRPEYVSFLFDGQSIFLEDYLLLRPENEERLRRQIQAGRLLIGPWYTLPDLYPVSGESLVRNLLKGEQVCRAFGHKLNLGYESFGWGQPGQLPQIYRGFGIDLVFVAKRVSEERAPESEFLWEGKDGTRVLASRLGADARANFYMNTYLEAMSGRNYKSDAFRYDYGKTRLYHRADPIGSRQDFFMLTYQARIQEEGLKELALRAWNGMEATRLKQERILMDGSDATCAQAQLPELLERMNEALKEEEITLSHVSMEDYAALLQERLSGEDLRVIRGELRDGPPSAASANALMTRYPLKQKNQEAEILLMDIAEPLSVIGSMLGLSDCPGYRKRALDELLGSQSHDSINGVVQDKTARDVMHRLEQCIELSGCVREQVIRALAGRISARGLCWEDVLLLLVNPLPVSRNEILRLVVDTPVEQSVWDFDARDGNGNRLECAHIARKEAVTPVVHRHTRPEPFYADRHEILLETGEIPAGGYKVVRLVPGQRFVRKQKFWPLSRVSDGRELGKNPYTMENQYLKAVVQPNGTVKLLEKAGGFWTGELNYLESGGDVGDYWVHYPPYHDQICSSIGVQADIRMEENTPLQTSICVSYGFRVPAFGMRPEAGIQGESGRSSEMTELPVRIRYTLKKDARKLEVTLWVKNTARDHRLSVHFDAGIEAAGAASGSHFCVEYRDRVSAAGRDGCRYPEMDNMPMRGFVEISDKSRGFGVISGELLEYNASRPGHLSCTLFRAVRNIICTEFRSGSYYPDQEGGQLLQELVYHYALTVHQGDWEKAGLPEESRRQMVLVQPVQFSVDGEQAEGLPLEKSFLEVSGAQVSCIKQGEKGEGIILRMYNVNTKAREARVRFALPIREAWLVDLKEDRLERLEPSAKEIAILLQPDQIVTIEVHLTGEQTGKEEQNG